MLEDKNIPLVELDIAHFYSITLECGRTVVSWKNSVNDLIALVKVALEASISLREAIEKDWQVHLVETLGEALELDEGSISFLERP